MLASRMARMPPSACRATYASFGCSRTTSRVRWNSARDSSSAPDAVSSRRNADIVLRWYALRIATTATTSVVTPATCLALILKLVALRLAASDRQFPHAIQLVVQRLQADTENLGRTRLVVARVLQGQHNQAPFRLVHRRARRQRDGRQRLLALRDQRSGQVL